MKYLALLAIIALAIKAIRVYIVSRRPPESKLASVIYRAM